MSDDKTSLTDDKKVLLLVAEAPCEESVTQFCQEISVQMYFTTDADEGVVLSGKYRPDLIMIDTELPGIEPLELRARFKADDKLSAVPIIALVAPEKDTDALKAGGFDDFLVKPIQHDSVCALLCQYILPPDRRAERIPYYTHVTIKDKDEFYFGLTGDVSMGGVFVATFDKLPENEDVKLSFTLSKDESVQVEVNGRVVWINSKASPVYDSLPEGFGVEFSSIGAKETLAIRELIEKSKK